MSAPAPILARRLGLGALVLIGVGDILGAGIYALVGKVVGIAGPGAWISFLISAALAAATGLSYAELSSRIPKSAGAAAYAAAAFKQPIVAFLVGFLVLASGLTSTATVALAFWGYLELLFPMPQLMAAIALILILTAVAWRGIAASAGTNNVLTLLETTGILIIIGVGFSLAARMHASDLFSRLAPTPELTPLITGATLAFYAFIGFEDLANLAEEAKDPQRDLPRAILIAVAFTTVLYLAVIVVVLWVIPLQQSATSTRPLLDVLAAAGTPLPAAGFAVLAICAITNTGLANFVMVSRLLYGMAAQGLVPRALGRVHPVHQTPWVSVLVAAGLTLLLVVTGGTRLLAQTTSLLLVIVFSMVHVSLIRVRRLNGRESAPFRVPRFVPWTGLLVSALLMFHFPADVFLRAGVILLVGGGLYLVFRSK